MIQVWYRNPTLWANVITIGSIILADQFGISISKEVIAGLLTIVNIVLQVPQMAPTQDKARARNMARSRE